MPRLYFLLQKIGLEIKKSKTMKKYYYSNGKDRHGPVTLEELKSLADLTPETLVWYQGLDTWVRAADVSELSDVFMAVPPPVPPAGGYSGSSGSSVPPGHVEQSMFAAPFSFVGRIRRQEYGLSVIISIFVAIISYYIFAEDADDTLSILIYCAIIIISNWFSYAQGAKRSHDIGKSGWWQLIPFYNIYLLFAEGDHGYNVYGADPKRNSVVVPRNPCVDSGNVNNNNVVVNVTGYPPPPNDR
jgi:uncharacterized membrane protein YhaH (DUF805 family)